jgi:hypothetical protein
MSNKDSEKEQIAHFYQGAKIFIGEAFEKEINDEIELEKKYGLIRTDEEMQRRKELQEGTKYYSINQNRKAWEGIRGVWKWLRKYYLNFGIKNSIDNYEYAKVMRKSFFISIVKSMVYSLGFTVGFYFFWMRLFKQKGTNDWKFLLIWNGFISSILINFHFYFFLIKTPLPTNHTDLERRKELLENFVYGSNMSFIISEEIKKISKLYMPEEIKFPYVTKFGHAIQFIVKEGRLYCACESYAEVFGHNAGKRQLKLQRLNLANAREREVVFALLKFYDKIINLYMIKYNIPKEEKEKNVYTQVLEEIAKDKQLDSKDIELLKKNKLLSEIEFNKIDTNIEGNNNIDSDIIDDKNKTKPKFYF